MILHNRRDLEPVIGSPFVLPCQRNVPQRAKFSTQSAGYPARLRGRKMNKVYLMASGREAICVFVDNLITAARNVSFGREKECDSQSVSPIGHPGYWIEAGSDAAIRMRRLWLQRGLLPSPDRARECTAGQRESERMTKVLCVRSSLPDTNAQTGITPRLPAGKMGKAGNFVRIAMILFKLAITGYVTPGLTSGAQIVRPISKL